MVPEKDRSARLTSINGQHQNVHVFIAEKKGRCGMWAKGEIRGYKFEAKHYDKGSKWGINEGRISKLRVTKDGIEVANYDRGWDILPATDEAQEVVSEVIQRYN